MPDSTHHEQEQRLASAQAEVARLTKEVRGLLKQRNALAAQLSETNRHLEAELKSTRSDAALVIHALNCALQLTEALIAFLPEGMVLPEGVKTAKTALDIAMHTITRTRQTKVPSP